LIDYSIIGRPILNIDPQNPNLENILAFQKKEYNKKLIIVDINRYQIKNVAQNFLNLISN
jgi:hypothetical protein